MAGYIAVYGTFPINKQKKETPLRHIEKNGKQELKYRLCKTTRFNFRNSTI